MEVLVRLSFDKYLKPGVVKTPFEAVEMSFENHFLPFFKSFDCHDFRKKRLWREENDVVFTRLYPSLGQIYNKNSGKYALPGQAKSQMSLDEFMEIFN